MEKRDLKADLEVCNRASGESWIQASNTEYPYTIMDETYKDVMAVYCTCNDAHFIAQAREGWPHAIERALKAEADFKRQEEYSDMLEDERNELYNLARELEDALGMVIGWASHSQATSLGGTKVSFRETSRSRIAEKVLVKAKEVLGDE